MRSDFQAWLSLTKPTQRKRTLRWGWGGEFWAPLFPELKTVPSQAAACRCSGIMHVVCSVTFWIFLEQESLCVSLVDMHFMKWASEEFSLMVSMVAVEGRRTARRAQGKNWGSWAEARNCDAGSQSYSAAAVPYRTSWRFYFFSNIGKGPSLCFASGVSSKPLGSFCGLEVPGEVGH